MKSKQRFSITAKVVLLLININTNTLLISNKCYFIFKLSWREKKNLSKNKIY